MSIHNAKDKSKSCKLYNFPLPEASGINMVFKIPGVSDDDFKQDFINQITDSDSKWYEMIYDEVDKTDISGSIIAELEKSASKILEQTIAGNRGLQILKLTDY